MKKRILLALLLCILTVFALASCGHECEYGEWQIESEATCIENGFMYRAFRFCLKSASTEVAHRKTQAPIVATQKRI